MSSTSTVVYIQVELANPTIQQPCTCTLRRQTTDASLARKIQKQNTQVKDLEDQTIISEEIKIGFPILPGLSRHKHVVAQGHAKKAHANFSNAIISSEPEAIGLSTVSGF